ncbi:MAG: TnpV protein [Ruminococcus sp.]|nr:TnpV protein [Ruminococcus sp.]
MNELPKKKIKNGIVYTLDEETQTYLPFFEEDNEPIEIGRFGRAREQYLKEHKDVTYMELLLSNRLTAHLIETDEQAYRMKEDIMQKMAAAEGTNEELKAKDQMEWVRRMNSYQMTAEEVIMKELIYV